MNCQEFWDTMPELAGGPEPQAAAHLGSCPSCAALLKNQREVAHGLRRISVDWSRVKAPARVESKLLAAFRNQAELAMPSRGRRWWVPAGAWLGAAAVVAAAMLLLVVRARQPAPLPKFPAGSELASSDWTARLPVEQDPSDANGGFLPLPNAARLAPNEDVNLVRVEVPRSAMIALGYVVPPERADERVQADVVLGSDGLARAVRFLDE